MIPRIRRCLRPVSYTHLVTYTVTITNPTDIPVADEVIRDTLPNGLEFVSAQIGNDNISETKQNILIDANHKCDFSVKNQILTWKIDKIDADVYKRQMWSCANRFCGRCVQTERKCAIKKTAITKNKIQGGHQQR